MGQHEPAYHKPWHTPVSTSWGLGDVGSQPVSMFPRNYTALGVKSQALEPGCPGWNTGISQLVCDHGHVLAHLGPSLLAYWPPVFLGGLKALSTGPGRAHFLRRNYHPPMYPSR